MTNWAFSATDIINEIVVDYLDFMSEDELREVITEEETDILYPIDFPVKLGVSQGADGNWYDAWQRPVHSSPRIACPFENDLMCWKVPLDEGPIYRVEHIRPQKMANGSWFWRVKLRRL